MTRSMLGAAAVVLAGCADVASVEEATASSSDALGAPGDDAIVFRSDRDEKRKAVDVDGKFVTVFSVPMDPVTAGETVAVRGEVTISRCDLSDESPCHGDAGYDPKLEAKIVFGKDAHDVGGPVLARAPDLRCSHATHHCTLVVPEALARSLAGRGVMNLVVSAGGGTGSRPVALVEQAHGGLYVTRMGRAVKPAGTTVAASLVERGTMPIDNVDTNPDGREDHVTFRAKIADAKKGDVLSVDARIVANVIGSKTCNPLILHQVFASTDPDPRRGKLLQLTADNGTNCTDGTGGASCVYRKSGAGALGDDPQGPVYVTVVSKAGRSCTRPGDRWAIAPGSDVAVTVRRGGR